MTDNVGILTWKKINTIFYYFITASLYCTFPQFIELQQVIEPFFSTSYKLFSAANSVSELAYLLAMTVYILS